MLSKSRAGTSSNVFVSKDGLNLMKSECLCVVLSLVNTKEKKKKRTAPRSFLGDLHLSLSDASVKQTMSWNGLCLPADHRGTGGKKCNSG